MRMRGRPRSRASSSRRPRSRDVLRARVTRARDEKTFFLPATTRRSLASTLDASPFARACAVSTSRASDVHPRARRHHTHRHHASHSTHVSLVVYTSHLSSTIVPSPPPPPGLSIPSSARSLACSALLLFIPSSARSLARSLACFPQRASALHPIVRSLNRSLEREHGGVCTLLL